MSWPTCLADSLAPRYVLEREIGRGGMAAVYLARDVRHDRPVALKALHSTIAATLGLHRFCQEVRVTSQLQHPHILPVLESGNTAGQPWYTMPYIEGGSLRDLLQRQVQLGVEEALRIVIEVADTLDYAHQQGVIHRDMKPENILLSRGHALVADFGVARVLGGDGARELSESGLAVGTPAYMSPEQATGDSHLDGRSDLYALGCVLYEMLAGEPPFTAPTPQALLARRLMEAVPSVRRLRETISPGLDQVLSRALAKIPADRFQAACEFADALSAQMANRNGASPRWTPKSHWYRRLAVNSSSVFGWSRQWRADISGCPDGACKTPLSQFGRPIPQPSPRRISLIVPFKTRSAALQARWPRR